MELLGNRKKRQNAEKIHGCNERRHAEGRCDRGECWG